MNCKQIAELCISNFCKQIFQGVTENSWFHNHGLEPYLLGITHEIEIDISSRMTKFTETRQTIGNRQSFSRNQRRL